MIKQTLARGMIARNETAMNEQLKENVALVTSRKKRKGVEYVDIREWRNAQTKIRVSLSEAKLRAHWK